MNTPSPEQLFVVASLRHSDVYVEAVAGAGKTTTVLHMARDVAPQPALLITYSRRLVDETRARAAAAGLTNLAVHTYHSLAVQYLSPKAHTDEGLRLALDAAASGSIRSRKAFAPLRLLVVDEAQDMSALYLELTLAVWRLGSAAAESLSEGRGEAGFRARLCVMGDRRQNIYRFKGADERFLTMAPRALGERDQDNARPRNAWVAARLGCTYRCSPAVCAFVNRVCLREDMLAPARPQRSAVHGVRYMCCDVFGEAFHAAVRDLVLRCGYGGVFILAPSVRASVGRETPLQRLANAFTRWDIPVFKPMEDEERLDEEVLRGKVVMCTYHQSKGLERHAVVVMGADDSYFQFYARGRDRGACPNELYVAMTRAREELLVVHNQRSARLPFLDVAALRAGAAAGTWAVTGFNHDATVESATSPVASRPRKMGVTDLLRHLPPAGVTAATGCLKVVRVRAAREDIDIPCKVTQPSGLVESVCEITGTAVPAAFEFRRRGAMAIAPDYTSQKMPSARRLLRLANYHCRSMSGYDFKTKQITDYGWLTEAALAKCLERLHDVISDEDDASFEERILTTTSPDRPELSNINLMGAMDALTDAAVFEIKCVAELTPAHLLQLALYGYMLDHRDDRRRRMLLYNMRSDEMMEVIASRDDLRRAVDAIVTAKNAAEPCHTDAAFLAEAGRAAASAERVVAALLPRCQDDGYDFDYDEEEEEPCTPSLVSQTAAGFGFIGLTVVRA